MNEKEQFAELSENLMDQPLNGETPSEQNIETPEEDEEEAKNRRERRLKDKLQSEREANIALAARLETLAETRKFQEDSKPSEYLATVERIYGTDSPEATAATELLKTALKGVKDEAKREALEELQAQQTSASAELKKEEQTLDSFVESIEDTYNVTLTPELQKGYFTMLEKMSPKDSSGNVIQYADPDAVWEIFSEKLQKRTDSRAKDLSARSMTQGNTSGGSNLQDDAMRSVMREAGII